MKKTTINGTKYSVKYTLSLFVQHGKIDLTLEFVTWMNYKICVTCVHNRHQLFLTMFNEGAYLTFKTIFHKALNLFQFDCDYHARIRSWNQPVLSNKGKVSCSMKQRGPLMGLETQDLHITSQTCNPLRHAAPLYTFL